MPAHSNALVASTFFTATLIADALSAIESANHADVPASFRGTCLALVSCFAAPLLVRPEKGIYGWLQRPIIGCILFVVSFIGLHRGSVETRTFDAAYTTIVATSITWLFSAGGVDSSAKASDDRIERAVSTSSALLSASLLLYGSLRTTRAGMRHATEVRDFYVQGTGLHNASEAVRSLGYAHASDVATVAVSFGGAVGVAAAVVVVLHAFELASGTDAVALQMAVAATCQLVAALIASLTYGNQVDCLSAVFGSALCSGGGCDAANASRRFAVINTQAPGLWLSALGLFALAFPVSTRFNDEQEVSVFAWGRASAVAGFVGTGLAMLLVFLYADFSGAGGHTDYVALAVVFAIYYSFFWDQLVGTFVIVAAYVMEEAFYVVNYGMESLLSYLTHQALIVCIVLLAMHVVLQLVLWCYSPRWLQIVIGMVTTAGVSVSIGLFLASCCLLLATNGAAGLSAGTDNGAHFAIAFTLQHFVPVLCWAPLFACRCEMQLLSRTQRLTIWLLVVPVVGVVWMLSLLATNKALPTAPLLEPMAMAGCVVGIGAVPWLAASSV
jgi:hypothetical protein